MEQAIPDYIRGKIIDMHCHFFPEKLFASLWDYFAARNWNIRYKDSPDGLAGVLKEYGVKRFVTYNYAHRRGMATDLNRWTDTFTRRNPDAVPFATVFPGDRGNVEMLDELFRDRGFAGIKIQPLVSDFYPWDERMFEVYRLLLKRGKILAVHAGTAPIANQYVGADNFEPVMKEFPEMKVIVAHMGAFECERFFDMARKYPNLYLDTSVSFIDGKLIKDLVSRGEFPPVGVAPAPEAGILEELSKKILFGSDFPNIPYFYRDCIQSVVSQDMGEGFNRAVFFENASRLLGLS